MVLNLVAQNMTVHLLNGTIVQGINTYYVDIMGPFWGVILALGIAIPLYVRTQSIEVVCGAWILVGYVLDDYMPVQALTTGRTLMILGVAIWLFKLVLGRREYG